MNIQLQHEAFCKVFKPEYGTIFNIDTVQFEPLEEKYYKDAQRLNWAFAGWLKSMDRDGFTFIPTEPTEEQWGGLSRVLGRYMQSKDRYCPKTLKKHLDMFAREIPDWLNREVGNWESEHAFATADLPVFIYKAMIEDYKK